MGTVVATDTHLGSYSIAVEPNVNDPGEAVPVPSGGTVNTAVSGGAWTLDTTGTQACGYVIRVVAVDRTVLNSQAVGHYRPDSDGFCLEVEADPAA